MNIESLTAQLNLPEYFVVGLLRSGLLGITNAGREQAAEGIRHFQEYGTQWQKSLSPRNAPYEKLPVVKGWENLPPAVVTHAQFLPYTDISVADDKQWLAHFYFRPNFFFFPDPAAMHPVGEIPVLLNKATKFVSGKNEVILYPDPDGRLALLAVTGAIQKGLNPLVQAQDIVMPVLNKLTAMTDQALPIVQKYWIGLPSGAVNIQTSSRPELTRLSLADFRSYAALEDPESLYRLGLTCNEPMYRFLSFWRVDEAVTRAQNQCQIKPDEATKSNLITHFPNHPAFGACAGKKLKSAIEAYQKTYRNAIAHGGLSSDEPVLSGASATVLAEMEASIPVMRYLAKARIENLRHLLHLSTCGGDTTNL